MGQHLSNAAVRSRDGRVDAFGCEQNAALDAEIARKGLPLVGIPPCASCHGPPARYPYYPEIAGQDAGFIARQLELFRDGTRGGTPFGHIMPVFARRLTDPDIAAVAAFYRRQAPGSRVAN